MSDQENIVATNDQPVANGPEGQNAVEGQQPAGQQQQQHFLWPILKGLIFRAVIVYFITSFFRRPQSPTSPASEMPSKASVNLFPNGTLMDLYVHLSDRSDTKFGNKESLVWYQPGLIYGDWSSGPTNDGIYTFKSEFETTHKMRNNGSIWLHVYIIKSGYYSESEDKTMHSGKYIIHKSKRINKFKKLRYQQTHNLLTGETAATPENIKKAEETPMEILSHWHPNMTINIIDDHTAWVQGQVPPPLNEFVEFDHVSGNYYPIVYLNDYWNLNRDYKVINATDLKLPIHLTFQPLSLFRWQLYYAQAMRSQLTSLFGQNIMEENEEDLDPLKEALLETSHTLLGLTIIVSIAHSVFEFLAFKNDIQFWNNRKSLEGLSVRSVFFNVFHSLVVLLYVLDNDTNLVVRISVIVGLLIEVWKIHKVTDVKINRESKILGIIPRISLIDKGSYVASSTKEYDVLAFRYLSWVLYPSLGCYAVYSLLYLEHKGWYSWVLSMLYGFLLTFGFIMMTPQLFINYKLKSVAHLPWRMLSYKFLNTIIDDIFAFVIKMPTMYRIGCFRDDIVFCIYLYQRWIYRVDPKRVNEFGTSGEMEQQEPASIANGAVVSSDDQQKTSSEKKNE